jgi:methylated-DNA-[protein]-cysteine S-methyltransferase
VSCTARGISGITIQKKRPPDDPTPASPREVALLAAAEHWLAGFFAGGADPEYLPSFDAPGSEFQKTVWNLLCQIERGQSKTYSEIAALAGKPGGSRAVGAACGANPLLLMVPCHRVLGTGGRLGGFSAGLECKQWLLTHEGIPFQA